MSFIILQILPYITVTIFVLGIMFRLGRWAGARIVHNIVLTPAPATMSGAAVNYAAEVALFRSVFKADKSLWAGAWIMHFALLNIIGGHIVGFAFLGEQFKYIGTSVDLSKYLSDLLGTSMGIIIFVALVYLLYRRLVIEEVKLVSYPADYLHLLLLIGIVSAGNVMRLFPEYSVDYETAQAYVIQLATFQAVDFSGFNLVFAIHLLLVQLLLMVFPFSKLLHLFGMFAERWIINRPYVEPAPGLPGAGASVASGSGAAVTNGKTTSGGV
ncbi:respiratory nitrate reductase subunit gamma [Desulfofalx alkaliphila]|uniref:respiratory nitrate reductase subunit gamma n=1 Tax=Desulfofalx alkaliphila TaxID=105483 RepID=UPI0004E20786|nr:respiratory nitrate reductase subunit gamma [Desulfofalx alkaliphila]